MLVTINYRNVTRSDTLDEFVRHRLDTALGKFGSRLTRVDVHLGDESSPKKDTPRDKRCLVEIRPAGHDPIATECRDDDDLYAAVTGAVGKARRATERALDRKGPVH